MPVVDCLVTWPLMRRCDQYTVNGKKIEIAVKKIVSGMRVVPSATVANPEALESYYKYQDIEMFAQSSKKGNGKDAKL